jgi:hypothetical protein
MKFKCNTSGSVYEFKEALDIKAMSLSLDYTAVVEVPEEKPVVAPVQPATIVQVKPIPVAPNKPLPAAPVAPKAV